MRGQLFEQPFGIAGDALFLIVTIISTL